MQCNRNGFIADLVIALACTRFAAPERSGPGAVNGTAELLDRA